MAAHSRRSVLKGFLLTASAIPFGLVGFRTKAEAEAGAQLVGAQREVIVARFINTVQYRERFAGSGRYLDLWDVPTSKFGRPLMSYRPDEIVFDRARAIIDGLTVRWKLRADRLAYELTLVDQTSGAAVVTDSGGGIHWGVSDPSAVSLGAESLRDQIGFAGTALRRRERAGLVESIASFMMPVVYASNMSRCCPQSDGYCSGSDNCDPATACNVGFYPDCVWCCCDSSDCQHCVPDGCTLIQG